MGCWAWEIRGRRPVPPWLQVQLTSHPTSQGLDGGENTGQSCDHSRGEWFVRDEPSDLLRATLRARRLSGSIR